MTNGQLLVARVLVVATAALVFAGLGFLLFGTMGLAIGSVITAPIAGMALAKPLVELSAEGLEWFSQAPHNKWNGHFYEFDGVQVRVQDDSDQLLIAAADACKACGIPLTADVKSRIARLSIGKVAGTSVAGVPWKSIDLLLGPDAGREAGRFKLWLKREVVAPWHNRRSIPFD